MEIETLEKLLKEGKAEPIPPFKGLYYVPKRGIYQYVKERKYYKKIDGCGIINKNKGYM